MRLSHVALWTHDLEAAAAFWSAYFGATIGDRYDSVNRPGFSSRFATLPDCGLRIEIMEGPWVRPEVSESCGWAHLALSVGTTERVDEIAARFRGSDLLASEPRRTGDGYYEAVVRTPEGTLIEIVE